MQIFLLFSILITLAAVFSYINVRILKFPAGIGLIMMGSLVSVVLIITGELSVSFTETIKLELSKLDFSEFILGILLSFLLFAGSLHVRVDQLRFLAKSIFSFALIGTLISTFLIAVLVYFLLNQFGMEVPFISCLMFGALISPTDPIAVMGILKESELPKPIEVRLTGESLFNDGIGVVVFATILEIALKGAENFSITSAGLLFVREAIGGALAGLVIGYIGYKMMKSIDHFQTEILISLAMVMGGYSFCHFIHVSGPLAMVVAGLFTGNKGRREAMSDITRDYLEKFWLVTDEILNAVLFILIGLELVAVSYKLSYLIIGIITALLLVIVRYVSLWIPANVFRFNNKLEKGALAIMTWGGLRGAISIALALSLPAGNYKNVFIAITFIVVLFSILVQGFTIGKFIKFIHRKGK